MFHFNSTTGNYESESLVIDGAAFAEARADYRRELERRGETYETAWDKAEAYLCQEYSWTEDMDGVTAK